MGLDMLVLIVCVILFFFKQKTAYEVRISDWSSDVCSSDLCHALFLSPAALVLVRLLPLRFLASASVLKRSHARLFDLSQQFRLQLLAAHQAVLSGRPWWRRSLRRGPWGGGRCGLCLLGSGRGRRSEEHTSELQSLMRIPYAVFCLKKKT